MKQVACKDCGFLCWKVSHMLDEFSDTIKNDEVNQSWRDREFIDKYAKNGLLEDGAHDEDNRLSCLRNQWWLGSFVIQGSKIPYVSIDAIFNPRNCHYFMRYQPGYSPEEHKELKREAETNRIIRNATLFGASIGAAAAIAAQLLYALFTR